MFDSLVINTFMLSSKIALSKFSNPARMAGVVFCLVTVVLVALICLPEERKWNNKQRSQHQIISQPKPTQKHGNEGMETDSHSDNRMLRAKWRPQEGRRVPSVDSHPAIERLLLNNSISHDETARQLAVIALDPNNPEAERLEAMEHGKNLGFAHLLPLSLDPNLPLPLAESFLHGLHGHDQTKEQVSGALGLLNHADSDIRQQAQTLLGFLLEAEEDNESSDKLRAAADAFLKQPDEEDGNEH